MPEILAVTAAFNLPIDEIIEEAFEPLGGEHMSGQDMRSARRSLNLVLQDMMTRGYPLIQTESRTLSVDAGVYSYELASDVLGIIDANVLDASGNEIPMQDKTLFDYFSITNKSTSSGLPTNYALDRSSSPARLYVYPNPSADTTINYWCVKKPKDVSKSYQLADVTARYLPAITMGLTFFLALKKPQIPTDRLQLFERLYKERLDLAFEEDRERGDIQIYPAGSEV